MPRSIASPRSSYTFRMPTSDLVARTAPFVEQRFVDSTGFALPYLWLAPAGETTQPQPLVVFFHGAGERGSDNHAQLQNGAAELLSSDDHRAKFPCFALLPQCPLGHRWVEVDWSADSHELPVEPSLPMAALRELLGPLLRDPRIDSARVYLIGLSMGGFAVWDLLCRQSTDFAATIAICGGADLAQAKRVAHLPIWLFHGAQDQVVSVERSRQMVEALGQAGHRPRYTEYAAVGHDSWSQAFADPGLLPWLFAQTKRR